MILDDPKKSTVQHYHYHAFPRRWRKTDEQNAKGLAILESLIKSGFLLAPERVVWPGEFVSSTKRGEGIISFDRRACFTYLNPSEISTHAEDFGAFAIEIDNWSLRTLGGIPIFYVPVGEEFSGYLGMGLALSARLVDLQELLERLDAFKKLSSSSPNPSAPMVQGSDGAGGLLIGSAQPGAPSLNYSKRIMDRVRASNGDNEFFSPKAPIPWGGSVGCVYNFLQVLTYGIQSLEVQLNSLRKFGGLFYPCERPGRDDLLTYYQQREWRILSGMMKEGTVGTRKPTNEEKERLLRIDPEFFGKKIDLRSGTSQVVDECEFLTDVDGKHVLTYARRLLCPETSVAEVRRLLDQGGFGQIPVAPIQS